MAQEIRKYTADQLIRIRKQMSDAEAQIHQATGRETELMAQLKRDFGVNNVEEAEARLKELDDEIASKTARLNAGLEKLKKDFNWEGK